MPEREIWIKVLDGDEYPRAPIAAFTEEMGRRPRLGEAVLGALDAWAVRMATRRHLAAGVAPDDLAAALTAEDDVRWRAGAIGYMAERVQIEDCVLSGPSRGRRGGRTVTTAPERDEIEYDQRSLHWFARVQLGDGLRLPLWWCWARELDDDQGHPIDHVGEAIRRTTAAFEVPDNLVDLFRRDLDGA